MMKKNVLVIGAGLAGTLICNELTGKCNITLLELGARDRISYPGVSCSAKTLAGVKTFCYGGGGTTNLWHNGLMPIHGADIDAQDFRMVLAEAKGYVNRAARGLFWLNDSYLEDYEKTVAEMDLTARKVGAFTDGIDCLLYPKKYKKLEADHRVQAFYSVNTINFEGSGRAIRSVRFHSGGAEHHVKADVVIVSAGALGSPRIVKEILSATGGPSNNAGAGFMDHPLGFVGKVKLKKHVNDLIRRFSLMYRGDYDCRTAVRIKSPCGKYTCAAFFRPALTMENSLAIYKFKSRIGANNGLDRIKNMFSLKILHPDILAEIASHLFPVTIPGRVYNVLMVFEQKRGKSRVSYDGNRLVVDWSITEEELHVYRDVLDKLRLMLLEIADEINVKTDIDESWLWSHAHHSGTISLGENADACVDLDLKLHSCDNVFVCDGSIIQEHSYANTGLTIGQLAMRLAERVLK